MNRWIKSGTEKWTTNTPNTQAQTWVMYDSPLANVARGSLGGSAAGKVRCSWGGRDAAVEGHATAGKGAPPLDKGAPSSGGGVAAGEGRAAVGKGAPPPGRARRRRAQG